MLKLHMIVYRSCCIRYHQSSFAYKLMTTPCLFKKNIATLYLAAHEYIKRVVFSTDALRTSPVQCIQIHTSASNNGYVERITKA